ncbi:hypothetical protein GCM10020001_076210 [Nonomuraea salmonea]
MHDTGVVHRGERRGDRGGQAVQVVAAERTPGIPQAGPLDVRADDVRPGPVEVGVQHPGGAERRDPLRCGGLLGQPLAQPRRPGRVAAQHLDGDPRAVLVIALVDDSLAALAEPAGQPVAAEPLRVPVDQWTAHAWLDGGGDAEVG